MDPRWLALGLTSGRRTYAGNRRVGGVPGSDHLNGTAADFTAPLSALQAQFPGHRILNEGDHRHVSGLSDVPYYGRNGTDGLVNGVDTSAPQGNAMLQPRKRPNYAGMSQPIGGIDPLGPMAMQQPSMPMQPQQPPQMPQPNFAAMSQPQGGHDPLAAHPSLFGKSGKGWAALGILGDALSAYGGQRGVFTPYMMQQNENEAEDNRFQQRLAAQQGEAVRRAEAEAHKPYRFQNNSGDVVEVDPTSGDQRVLYMDPVGKTDYARITDPTTGEISITPQGQSARPSPAHIDALRQHPERAAEFDAKFGRGAAQYILGGR